MDDPQKSTTTSTHALATRLNTEIERWKRTPDEAVVAAELALAVAEARAADCHDLANVIESAAAESVLPIPLRLMALSDQAQRIAAEAAPALDPSPLDAPSESTTRGPADPPDPGPSSKAATPSIPETPAWLRPHAPSIDVTPPADAATVFPRAMPIDISGDEQLEPVAASQGMPPETAPAANDSFARDLFGAPVDRAPSAADPTHHEPGDAPAAPEGPLDTAGPTLFDRPPDPPLDEPIEPTDTRASHPEPSPEPAAEAQADVLDRVPSHQSTAQIGEPSTPETDSDGSAADVPDLTEVEATAMEDIDAAHDALGEVLAGFDDDVSSPDVFASDFDDGLIGHIVSIDEIEPVEPAARDEISHDGIAVPPRPTPSTSPEPVAKLATSLVRTAEPLFEDSGWFVSPFDTETRHEAGDPRIDPRPESEIVTDPVEVTLTRDPDSSAEADADVLAEVRTQATVEAPAAQPSESTGHTEHSAFESADPSPSALQRIADRPAAPKPEPEPEPVAKVESALPLPVVQAVNLEPEPEAPPPALPAVLGEPAPASPPVRPGPITVRVLRARVGGQLVAFRLEAVQRVVKPSRATVGSIGGASVLRLRDDVFPIIDLHQVVGEPLGDTVPVGVVVEAGGQSAVVLVTSIVDQREATTRPAESAAPGPFVGITVDEAGAIALVLDTERVVRTAPPAPAGMFSDLLGAS